MDIRNRDRIRQASLTTLLLRNQNLIHAPQSYRVIYEDVEVGSIGLQLGTDAETFWSWGIDTISPSDGLITDGRGENREDCMVQFKAAWHKFSRNPERLKEYLFIKRDLQRKWRTTN